MSRSAMRLSIRTSNLVGADEILSPCPCTGANLRTDQRPGARFLDHAECVRKLRRITFLHMIGRQPNRGPATQIRSPGPSLALAWARRMGPPDRWQPALDRIRPGQRAVWALDLVSHYRS